MSAVSKLDVGRPVRTGANLTPMIDMTFLLVVFFVLVSRITAVEQVPMELPVPRDPAAGAADEAPRIVVNLVHDELAILHSIAEVGVESHSILFIQFVNVRNNNLTYR